MAVNEGRHDDVRIACITLIVALACACQASAPSPSSPPPSPVATSFDEYAVGFCAAFDALFVAVGNPDTGSGSELSKALDSAVAAGDGASADVSASQITSELESGRQHVAYARGWPPAAPMLAHLDQVFLAFETMTAAKRAVANHAPGAVDPQAAFEQAGGLEAWTAMLTAWTTIERPDAVQQCANVPISP